MNIRFLREGKVFLGEFLCTLAEFQAHYPFTPDADQIEYDGVTHVRTTGTMQEGATVPWAAGEAAKRAGRQRLPGKGCSAPTVRP